MIKNLEPVEVFEIFHEITQIPRCSKNEKAISEYIINFAKSLNLEYYTDNSLNVVVKKAGTKGYENSETLILQGHTDMVCVKEANIEFDFDVQQIETFIEDGFIKAKGTTLGADNGIALAYMLAILKSTTIEHPPIEAVFTSDEEEGMCGAKELDYSILKGRKLINLDSEEEGFILVSCAGGMRGNFNLPITLAKSKMDFKAAEITIKGLKGGHSGVDIHLERANANKLMGRVLQALMKERLIYIKNINGGSADNAIPRECSSVICFEEKNFEAINEICKSFESVINEEYNLSEKAIILEVEQLNEVPAYIFSNITAIKAVTLLMLIPNGVQSMSLGVKDLVESSNNLGVVKTNRDDITFNCAIRSSQASRKALIGQQMQALGNICGADFEIGSEYPGWAYSPSSPLRDVLVSTYKEMSGKNSEIIAIHAGLECGIFSENLPGCDIVSIGPDMFNVHSPEEKLSIESTKRTWCYLKEILKNLK